MPWVKRIPDPAQHACDYPHQGWFRSKTFTVGSIWRCGECSRYWRYTAGVVLGYQPFWEQLTRSEALGFKAQL